MMNFLNKNYNLWIKIPQTNNFMIFREFYLDISKINQKNIKIDEDDKLVKYQQKNSAIYNSSSKLAIMGRDLISTNVLITDKTNSDSIQGKFNKNYMKLIPLFNNIVSNNYGNNIKSNQFKQENILSNSNNNIFADDKYSLGKDKNIEEKGFPKSSNFAERKNFALYYLSDLSNPKNFPQNKISTSFPINNNTKLIHLKEYISPHEQYFNERFSSSMKDIEMTKDRVKNMEVKVNPYKSEFYEYNKRNEYAVINDKPLRKQNLLYYLQNTEGLYNNKKIEVKPMQSIFK